MSQQRLILKWANNPKTGEIISREVNNLRAIHARADYEGIDLDWMQDLPLATFKRDDFFAFIGVKYGKDLFSVMNVDLPNAQRARLCKMIVRAYAKTRELQFWNGDIKSDNIVYHGEKIVFIDWAGARSLYPQVEKFKRPLSRTPLYANPDLLHKMEAIIDEYKESGANDQLKEEFIQTAEALELFSVGVTLFNVLTCRWPFLLVYDFRYEANLPFPSGGFEKKSWDIFLKKKYDPAIVQTMKVMLDPSDPITPTEAIAMWESIK